MIDLNKIVEDAINKYFDALSKVGYLKEDDMYYLLILSFIQDITSYNFSELVDEDSYKVIIDAIYTLSCKSCLFSVPYLPTFDDLFRKNVIKKQLRITQGENLRHTENSINRVKA